MADVPISEAASAAHSRSQASIVWTRFRRHRLAIWSVYILAALYGLALFADFVAPYGEGQAFRRGAENRSYAPPTKVRWRDPESGRLTRPFVYPVTASRDMATLQVAYIEDESQQYPIQFFVRGTAYVPPPVSFIPPKIRQQLGINITSDLHLFGVEFPATIYLWGADQFGRDVFGICQILVAAMLTTNGGFIDPRFTRWL